MNRRTFTAKVLGLFAVGVGVKAAASEGHWCGVVGIGERVEALSLELDKDVEFIKTAKIELEYKGVKWTMPSDRLLGKSKETV